MEEHMYHCMMTWTALVMYLGMGKLDQIVVHYFYLNYFSFQESLCPKPVNTDTSIHIFLKPEKNN